MRIKVYGNKIDRKRLKELLIKASCDFSIEKTIELALAEAVTMIIQKNSFDLKILKDVKYISDVKDTDHAERIIAALACRNCSNGQDPSCWGGEYCKECKLWESANVLDIIDPSSFT